MTKEVFQAVVDARQDAKREMSTMRETVRIRAEQRKAERKEISTSSDPWAYGWYEQGGTKCVSPYLPTASRLKNAEGDAFSLYTADAIASAVASATAGLERSVVFLEGRIDAILDELATERAAREAAEQKVFELTQQVETLKTTLEIIAGKRQCIDNLMGNGAIALAALASLDKEK